MAEIADGLRLLLLLAAANTAPLLAKRVLGTRFSWPLDGGLTFVDGKPLLGRSKTWRGVLAAVLLCCAAAPILHVPWRISALFALASMAGDSLSSFVKRRLGVASSGQAYGLDQIPEALVPLLAIQGVMPIPWQMVLGVTLAFLLLEPPLARLTHHMGLRDQPY